MYEDSVSRRQVQLPERLVTQIESRLDRSGFDTADEYVEFVLLHVLARVTDDDHHSNTSDEVQARLESLGYVE